MPDFLKSFWENLDTLVEFFYNPRFFRLSLPDVWDGMQLNLRMMVIAEALVLVFALALAVTRGLPGRAAAPLRALVILYIDVFRGTPLILTALLLGLGLPALQLAWISDQSFLFYGIMAITLTYTAYVTEVYRAGIESVHQSQRMAARSLGLNYAQAMRYVVLPQAVRRVIPPLLNDFIGLQKDTGIIYVIGVGEAVQQANVFSGTYYNATSYVVAAVFFIYLTIPLARFTDHLIAAREARERTLQT
jgi:polar amino acid transport system permease protein